MVNMYGAGKAFNLRFQQRGISQMRFRQPQPRMPIMTHCHGHHSGPTNVTINQGPQGFWGFLGGFFGGLFGSGILGGLFGGRQQAMYNPSPYGMLNQQMTLGNTQGTLGNDDNNNLARLKSLYPGYNIVPEGDGKFSATKDNQLVADHLSYDEMKKALGGATPTDKVEIPKTEEKGAGNVTESPEYLALKKQLEEAQANDATDAQTIADLQKQINELKQNKSTENTDGDGTGNQNATVTGAGNRAAALKGTGNANGTGKTDNTTPTGDGNKNVDKSAAHSVEVRFSIATSGSNKGTGTVTATLPDGTQVVASVDEDARGGKSGRAATKLVMQQALGNLATQIKAQGWTNVQLSASENIQNLFGNDLTINTKDVEVTDEDKTKAQEKTTVKDPTADGEQVAKDLVGKTDTQEKGRAIETIYRQNADSITDFIKAYSENQGIIGDSIIRQIATEGDWNAAERRSTTKNIIAATLEKAAADGKAETDSYKNLAEILNKLNSDNSYVLDAGKATQCDNYIKNLLLDKPIQNPGENIPNYNIGSRQSYV